MSDGNASRDNIDGPDSVHHISDLARKLKEPQSRSRDVKSYRLGWSLRGPLASSDESVGWPHVSAKSLLNKSDMSGSSRLATSSHIGGALLFYGAYARSSS
jgi:hypothetical protein